MSDKWKIVDTFGGGTIKTYDTGDTGKPRTALFDSEAEAEEFVDSLIEEQKKQPGMQRSIPCMDVVPERATWEFDVRRNKYIWDY